MHLQALQTTDNLTRELDFASSRHTGLPQAQSRLQLGSTSQHSGQVVEMGHFIQRSSPCALPRISCWHDSGTDCECMLLSFTCFTCKSWKVYRKLNRPAGLSRLKIINKLDLRAVYHIKLRFVA